MALNLHTNDLVSLSIIQRPNRFNKPLNYGLAEPVELADKRAGKLTLGNVSFPHMHINTQFWQIGDNPISLRGNELAQKAIHICFLVSGILDTKFNGIKTALKMRQNKHNLVFLPEPGEQHFLGANQLMSALEIQLDEDYFLSCLNENESWTDRIRKDIEQKKPLAAVPEPVETTLQMQQLVQSIISCNVFGPMRNLLIQSRTLELLALQMEQFYTSRLNTDFLKKEDLEKIHQLKNYFDQNFLGDLNLTRLCRLFLINDFKLKKGFKTLFNCTVFGYIRKLRMEYATLLLRDNANSVDQVAYQLGYEHSNHFAVAFKKYFGFSPAKFYRSKAVMKNGW